MLVSDEDANRTYLLVFQMGSSGFRCQDAIQKNIL